MQLPWLATLLFDVCESRAGRPACLQHCHRRGYGKQSEGAGVHAAGCVCSRWGLFGQHRIEMRRRLTPRWGSMGSASHAASAQSCHMRLHMHMHPRRPPSGCGHQPTMWQA